MATAKRELWYVVLLRQSASTRTSVVRLLYRIVSYGEDAVPVRLTMLPGMTSARQLEPAVPIKGLMYTGRYLHYDSGRA